MVMFPESLFSANVSLSFPKHNWKKKILGMHDYYKKSRMKLPDCVMHKIVRLYIRYPHLLALNPVHFQDRQRIPFFHVSFIFYLVGISVLSLL